jgi:hypothetical protein
MVTFGMGASLVVLLGEFPQLIWLSENKNYLFLTTVVMVGIAGLFIFLQRNAPCPIDPVLRQACLSGRKWSFRIWLSSVLVLTTGSLVTYVLPLMQT